MLAFKKYCLNKIKSAVVRYLLGMLLAYSLLFLLDYGAYYNIILKLALQNGSIFIFYGPPLFGMVMIVIPGLYSIFLIGKGYFGEGGNEASWKWKLKMMASLLLNGFIAFFALLNFNLFLQGESIHEVAATFIESFQYIDWWYTVAFLGCCALFVFFMWLDHKHMLRKKQGQPKNKDEIINWPKPFKIGEVSIIPGKSTPQVFSDSPYYVDYDSCVAVKGVPFCMCLIREKADSKHIIGEIGIVDSEDNEDKLSASVLGVRVIYDGTKLNEHSETDIK